MKKKSISLNLSLTRETCKKFNGFTLFELLVSISIIGILTALASVAFSGTQKKARDARRMEDIKLIQTAAEQYYSQNKYVYPDLSASKMLQGPVWTGSDGQVILESWPKDPKKNTLTSFFYIPSATNDSYCVCILLEDTTRGNASNATCSFVSGGSYFCAKNQQ